MPLIRYEAQPGMGLALRKHTLAKRGAIAHNTVRKPGGVLSASAISELEALIARQEEKLRGLGMK